MATRYGITTAVKVNGVPQRSIWADPAQGLAWIIDQSRMPHSYATRALATSGDAIGSVDRSIEITSAIATKALG